MKNLIEINGRRVARFQDNGLPTPEYMEWLKEHREALYEERKFQEFALSEADRLIKSGGSVDHMDHVPLLQDAVRSIMKNDPRSK